MKLVTELILELFGFQVEAGSSTQCPSCLSHKKSLNVSRDYTEANCSICGFWLLVNPDSTYSMSPLRPESPFAPKPVPTAPASTSSPDLLDPLSVPEQPTQPLVPAWFWWKDDSSPNDIDSSYFN